MPQLFTLQKQAPLVSGAVVPGGKLHFFQTGTTTRQNTYQDITLDTAHENPVVADATGVFPIIYLDPSLPDYRVRLTTSDDVTLWDDQHIPSGQDESRSYRITDTAPEIVLDQTGASANNRKWFIRAASGALTIGLLNDAESVRTDVIQLTRSGSTALNVNFYSDNIAHDGELIPTYESDTFTGTLAGFSGTAPSDTCRYTRIGDAVVLWVPPGSGGFNGTSNASSMIMSGVPAAIRPARTQYCAIPDVTDNGSIVTGAHVAVSSIGEVTFFLDGSSTGFTSSGTKGTAHGFAISYLLT